MCDSCPYLKLAPLAVFRHHLQNLSTGLSLSNSFGLAIAIRGGGRGGGGGILLHPVLGKREGRLLHLPVGVVDPVYHRRAHAFHQVVHLRMEENGREKNTPVCGKELLSLIAEAADCM